MERVLSYRCEGLVTFWDQFVQNLIILLLLLQQANPLLLLVHYELLVAGVTCLVHYELDLVTLLEGYLVIPLLSCSSSLSSGPDCLRSWSPWSGSLWWRSCKWGCFQSTNFFVSVLYKSLASCFKFWFSLSSSAYDTVTFSGRAPWFCSLWSSPDASPCWMTPRQPPPRDSSRCSCLCSLQ